MFGSFEWDLSWEDQRRKHHPHSEPFRLYNWVNMEQHLMDNLKVWHKLWVGFRPGLKWHVNLDSFKYTFEKVVPLKLWIWTQRITPQCSFTDSFENPKIFCISQFQNAILLIANENKPFRFYRGKNNWNGNCANRCHCRYSSCQKQIKCALPWLTKFSSMSIKDKTSDR